MNGEQALTPEERGRQVRMKALALAALQQGIVVSTLAVPRADLPLYLAARYNSGHVERIGRGGDTPVAALAAAAEAMGLQPDADVWGPWLYTEKRRAETAVTLHYIDCNCGNDPFNTPCAERDRVEAEYERAKREYEEFTAQAGESR